MSSELSNNDQQGTSGAVPESSGMARSVPRMSSGTAFVLELSSSLAFFQFALLVLPYGFLNLTGINLPYTDTGFIIGFLLLLFCVGPALGIINVILTKFKDRRERYSSVKATNPGKSISMILLPYLNALMLFLLFFINKDGWHSEMIPVFIYLFTTLSSGILARSGLSNLLISRGSKSMGLGMALSMLMVLLIFFAASFNFELLMFFGAILSLSIPPLVSLIKNVENDASPPTEDENSNIIGLKYAWFDKIFKKKDKRAGLNFAIIVLMATALSNLFSSIIYFRYPHLDFTAQVFAFFLATIISTPLLLRLYSNRPVSSLIIISIAVLAILEPLGDYLPGFANGIIIQLASGAVFSAGIILLLRAKEYRAGSGSIVDSPGSVISSIYTMLFVSALIGLLISLSLTLGSLGADTEGYLPVRIIFQSIILFISIMSFIDLGTSAKEFKKIEKGEKRKVTSLQDFINMQSKPREKKGE
ncbi:MAG: hypothetical protein ACTSVI_11235 [Promethearchaeota archaeon]